MLTQVSSKATVVPRSPSPPSQAAHSLWLSRVGGASTAISLYLVPQCPWLAHSLGLVVVWFLLLLGLEQARVPETSSQTQSVIRPEQGARPHCLKLISARREA